MAKAAKPGAKPEAGKPDAKPTEEKAANANGKSKKKLIVIVILLLLVGGVATALLWPKPTHKGAAAEKAAAEAEREAKSTPIFAELGTFTANLAREDGDGDRYLQIAISLKLAKPELVDKIKANNPEILHRVNMLLQSKRPSELATFEGKEMLGKQIKGQVEYVMGMR